MNSPLPLQYSTVGHITGTHAANIDLTSRLPWLYVIVSSGSRVIYIGETYAEGGLIKRLSQHFGPFAGSSLKQRAEEVSSIRSLRLPYIIVAARLPLEDDAPFDGSAKQVRLICEAILHEIMALQFLPSNPEWTIISTPQGSRSNGSTDMALACESIFFCFESAHTFLEPLSTATPFQLVILDKLQAQPMPNEQDLGRLIEDIEMSLYQWMFETLRTELAERWWSDGVPETIRVQCATRREQESKGASLPAEAYMTLVDMIDIARKNWPLFQNTFEQISGSQGKDRATQWLGELNEMRKLWAHPIKRLFAPVDPARIMAVHSYNLKVKRALTGNQS